MQTKKTKKTFFIKFISSKFFLVLGIIIFLFITVATVKKMAQNYSVDNDVAKLKREIGELEKQNNEFSELVNYLNTEDFLEKEARLKFGLRKAGESEIIITKEEKNGTEENSKEELKVRSKYFAEQKNNKEKISNYKSWWKYFFTK